jgi:hypothetical protein
VVLSTDGSVCTTGGGSLRMERVGFSPPPRTTSHILTLKKNNHSPVSSPSPSPSPVRNYSTSCAR